MQDWFLRIGEHTIKTQQPQICFQRLGSQNDWPRKYLNQCFNQISQIVGSVDKPVLFDCLNVPLFHAAIVVHSLLYSMKVWCILRHIWRGKNTFFFQMDWMSCHYTQRFQISFIWTDVTPKFTSFNKDNSKSWLIILHLMQFYTS